MTPAARIQATIEIMEALENTTQPADRFLRDWFRTRRYAGSKDRASIAERLFDVLRHRSSYAFRMGEGARAAAIASLLAEGAAVEELFSGAGYGPGALTDEERARLEAPPTDDPPPPVAGEYPPFLEGELARAFEADLPGEMLALQSRAPIDLRANTLKTTRDDLLAALKSEGFDAAPTPYAPHAIRLAAGEGMAALGRSLLFAQGHFEFQDEASQLAALACGARPGMRVLDLAAGAGGKALALAAAMENRGEIVAMDEQPERLKPLAERAARAGATIIRFAGEGAFDIVLADAPCSGTGTWRRQPELRWRLTPERLAELTQIQDRLLAKAARAVRPGGRLVYVTCSLLPCENDDRIAHFLETNPGFTVVPMETVWRDVAAPPQTGRFFRASPRRTGTDGFFTAVLQRDQKESAK